jgi:hypothetical protein
LCEEFSYNNKVQSSTGHSPFYISHEQCPYKGTNIRREVKSQLAKEFTEDVQKVQEEAAAALK